MFRYYENPQTRDELQKVLHSPGFSAKGAGDTIQFLPSGERLGGIVLVQVQSA